MGNRDGIQILPDIIQNVQLSTLGPNIALQLSSTYSAALLKSFLMQKAQFEILLEEIDPLDFNSHILFGLARGGDVGVTEIAAALQKAQVEPDRKDQAIIRDVLHDTVRLFQPDRWSITVGDHASARLSYTVNLGGSKGIPFENGDGWQLFAYNVGNLAIPISGSRIFGKVTYYGVWLD